MTVEEMANDLVQGLNVDTLPVVTELEEENLHRVFGGVVSEQVILLTNEDIKGEEKEKIERVFEEAAKYNKNEQLAFERAIFTSCSSMFF